MSTRDWEILPELLERAAALEANIEGDTPDSEERSTGTARNAPALASAASNRSIRTRLRVSPKQTSSRKRARSAPSGHCRVRASARYSR